VCNAQGHGRGFLLAGTTIVALTGYGMEKDREQSRAAGFDEHIIKPVDFDRLRELLEKLPSRSE
jgi:CheY-like chemotaxis protein